MREIAAAVAGCGDITGRVTTNLCASSDVAARLLRKFSMNANSRTPKAPVASSQCLRGAFVNMVSIPISISTACTGEYSRRTGAYKNSDSDHNTRDARRKKRERFAHMSIARDLSPTAHDITLGPVMCAFTGGRALARGVL